MKIVYKVYSDIYKNIKRKFDLYEVGRVVTNFLIKEFEAVGCELKILEENNHFARVHFVLRENEVLLNDQNYIERKFGIKKTPFEQSEIGECVNEDKPFLWVESDSENFLDHIEEKTKQGCIFRESAEKYYKEIDGGIKNHLIMPIVMPKKVIRNEKFVIKCCIHFFNLFNGSKDKRKIESRLDIISEIIELLSVNIFNVLFYTRAVEEIEIDDKLKEITYESKNIEIFLKEVVSFFADRLKAPLSTIWFYDTEHLSLVMHSAQIKTHYSYNKALSEDELSSDIKNAPRIFTNKDKSIIGTLISGDEPWLKYTEVDINPNYNWVSINKKIETKQFIALPIRDEAELIAIVVLHPNLSVYEFERIQLSYFSSFTKQISTALKYFIEKNNSKSAKDIFTKLEPLLRKNPEKFYYELVHKIMEVIDAEACSLFEVKSVSSHESGIFLISTTDKTEESRKIISDKKKVYDINEEGITPYVARKKKPIIVYDVKKVMDQYPEIKRMSENFLEKTENPHTSYIAVTIPKAESMNSKNKSFLILRCINKRANLSNPLNTYFNTYDRELLNYVSVVLESYRKIFEVIKERNDLLLLISHEIKNPINAIRSKIEKIYNSDTDSPLLSGRILRDKLGDININSLLMVHWFNSIEFLNQLMQGKSLKPKNKKINLYQIIVNIKYWLLPVLDRYNVDLNDIDISGFDKHLWVEGDEKFFIHVFYNLINNAAKYKRYSEKSKIRIESQKLLNEVGIKIMDWGVGIKNDDVTQIFQRSFRGSYAYIHNIDGNGFGLWLCKRLLNSNGFDIRLAQLENPTMFEIVLPNKFIK